MPCAATWMDLGNIILSKTQKHKYHMTTLICGIQFFKMTQMNLLRTQKETFEYRKQAYGQHWRNVEGGIHQELEINIYNCHAGLFVTPQTVVQQAPLSMEFPGQNTGVRFHFLLQGIFPIKGPNLLLMCLLHWQVDSLPLHHLGSPHTQLYIIEITKKDLPYSRENSTQYSVINCMRKESENEGIHVYVQLSHFVIHLKLTQHCKSLILQENKTKI